MKILLSILFLLFISIEVQPTNSMDVKEETVTNDGHSRVVSSGMESFDPGPDMLSPMTRLQAAKSASLESYYAQQRLSEKQQVQEELDLLVAEFLKDQPLEEDPELAEALRRSELDALSLTSGYSTSSSSLPSLSAGMLPLGSLPPLPSSSLVHTPSCSLSSSSPRTVSTVLSSDNKIDSPSGGGVVTKEDRDFDFAVQQSLREENDKRCKALQDEIRMIDEQRDILWKELMQIWEDRKGVDEKFYASMSSTDNGSTTAWTQEDDKLREKYQKRESEIFTLRDELKDVGEKLQKELSERRGY